MTALSNLTQAYKFPVDLLNRHPVHKQLALFLVCFATSFLIFFFRNPDPFINPVFYTEDGRDYVGRILSQGFWSALFHARPDYFVFGNILLTEIALLVNNLFYSSGILYLPQTIAIVSYLFYAFVATLPILLFADRIKTSYLIALALISTFFPLHSSDFEVLGRISNVGYAFIYIAFLLIAYRLFCVSNFRLTIAVDLLILICASTNPVVYLIFPVIYIPYLKRYFIDRVPLNHILKNYSFLSALVIGTIVLLQIGTIMTTGSGLNSMDVPFDFSNAIEMLIARSMLYPVIYSIYSRMNDLLVILLFAIIIIGFIRLRNKNNYGLYIFGFYSLVTITLSAARFRPVLSSALNNYSTTWPDRYYYGQNLLVTFLIILLFNDISNQIKLPSIRKALLVGILVIFLADLQKISTYGQPASVLREIGNFEQTLVAALKEKETLNINDEFIELPIYPPPTWKMTIPRDLAEKSAARGKLIKMLDKC